MTFYFIKNNSKSSFKISYIGKVLTLPPMRVNAIFLRISIYVPRLQWLSVKFIRNWTFELSEQVIATKISQKCYILVVIEQVPIGPLHSLLHNRHREAHLARLTESLIWLPTKGWTGCHSRVIWLESNHHSSYKHLQEWRRTSSWIVSILGARTQPCLTPFVWYFAARMMPLLLKDRLFQNLMIIITSGVKCCVAALKSSRTSSWCRLYFPVLWDQYAHVCLS